MTTPLPTQDNEEDFGIDMSPEPQDDWESRSIDMKEYKDSQESKDAGVWDYVNDAIIQPSLGSLKAFSWPLDVIKLGMIGEGLSDIDELEAISKREGKAFDRDKYVKDVLKQSEFIPTQELLEDVASKKTGISFEPKTKPGKALNKLFFLRQIMSGKGLAKSLKAAGTGVAATETLKGLGVNETAADIIGDVAAGSASELEKVPRKLSKGAQELRDIGQKHGLPLMEALNRDNLSYSAKISPKRQAHLDKQLGISSKEAVNKIIEGNLPIAKMRNQGVDLEAFEDFAYDEARKLAHKNTNPLKTDGLISDIDAEIARIKRLAPSPSEGQRAALKILEEEKSVLEKATPNTEQLINQRQNYNSNVKNIYKKGQLSGTEEDVKNTYAFLNSSIDRTIEQEAGKNVADTYKVAREIYGQNQNLARTEGLINQAFENDTYNPKKLKKVLDSKQGQKLRRDIGDQGVKELHEIAKYGEKAQQVTKQYAGSANKSFNIKEWGPLAGFLLSKISTAAPKTTALLLAAKPFADYVRGYVLTNPGARTVYRGIVKDIANGSLKNVAADFAKIESMIVDEYGSMDDFIKQGINELQIFNDEED